MNLYPYPDPTYTSYCKGYDEGYDFYWRTSTHPIKPNKALTIDQHDGTTLADKGIGLENLRNHTGAIEYFDKSFAIDSQEESLKFTLNKLDNNLKELLSKLVLLHKVFPPGDCCLTNNCESSGATDCDPYDY